MGDRLNPTRVIRRTQRMGIVSEKRLICDDLGKYLREAADGFFRCLSSITNCPLVTLSVRGHVRFR